MMVAQEDLDEWRAFCGRLSTSLCAAEGALAAGSFEQARELLWSAQDSSARMAMKLEIAGAGRSDARKEPSVAPARQWYALMLRDAWDASRQVELEADEQAGASNILRLLLKEVEAELYPE